MKYFTYIDLFKALNHEKCPHIQYADVIQTDIKLISEDTQQGNEEPSTRPHAMSSKPCVLSITSLLFFSKYYIPL